MKKFSAFTYLDVISGLTVILIVLGSIYGAIRLVEKTTQENTLVSRIDSFANWIFEEINLRKFDENIESIEENGLTLNFGTEADENINNLSSLDDIDDFVTEDLTNTAFPQLEANIIVNYVDIDLETNSIIPTINPTTLKRVKLNIRHPSFDSPINYTKIFAGNFDPELLIVRSYPVGITVNRSSDQINILELGASLTFTVEFNSDVFVIQDDNFEFYIDIKSGVLAGSEGSYNTRPSNIGEVKASYLGGSGTRFLTFLLTNSAELQLSGSDLDDYIGYRPNLVMQNGSVRDIEGVEVLYGLPNEGEAASFTSNVNILPLLQEFNTKVYTTEDELAFNRELAVRFVPQSARDIFNNWPRTERNVYFANKADAENGERWYSCFSTNGNYIRGWCASIEWELLANPERVSQPENVSYLNTFISPDSLENYTFEVTLYSNNRDDDYVGLVIAYERNKEEYCSIAGDHDPNTCITEEISNGINNKFLILMRSGNGFKPLNADNGRFGIIYWQEKTSGGRDTRTYWSRRVFDESTARNQNWENNQYTRVKIVRDGNIIKAWTGPFTNVLPDPDNPQYSDDYIEIDLANDRRLHKFIGKRQYGYATISQASSQYYDVSLAGGTLQRRDVQILFDLSSGNITRYYKKTDGDPIEQDVARLQSDIGYLRPLYNEETGKKYLLMRDGIIEYPFNED